MIVIHYEKDDTVPREKTDHGSPESSTLTCQSAFIIDSMAFLCKSKHTQRYLHAFSAAGCIYEWLCVYDKEKDKQNAGTLVINSNQ